MDITIGKLKPETIQAIVDEMAKTGTGMEHGAWTESRIRGTKKKITNNGLLPSVILVFTLAFFSLPALGDAEWDATSKKRRAIIYWRKPEDWAAMISSWVRNAGRGISRRGFLAAREEA